MRQRARKPGPETGGRRWQPGVGMSVGGGKAGGTEDGRVQETPLRVQETLWWDLKSRCDDVAVGLSPKPSMGSVPRLGRCPGKGHGNPLQYSCLENPMD